MQYNILETNIEFKNGDCERVTVLVDMTPTGGKPFSDLRAITATPALRSGYLNLIPHTKISERLLYLIAASGMEVDKDEFFPRWKTKYL